MSMTIWPRWTTAGTESPTVWPRFLIDSALVFFPSEEAQRAGLVVPPRAFDGVTIQAVDRVLLAAGDRATLEKVSRLFEERAALAILRGAGRVAGVVHDRATTQLAGRAES